MKPISIFPLALLAFFLVSCSSTQQAYLKNIDIFLEANEGVVLSDEEIVRSKADLIYVISGDRAQATMALAFIEENNYKWVSRDNAVFINQQGRLKRTSGFARDLLFVSSIDEDPIQLGLGIEDNSTWVRYVDVESDFYGVQLSSKFSVASDIELSIQGKVFRTKKVTEYVAFTSNAHKNDSWENIFWYDLNSGALLKSIQKNTPEADVYQITYVSRALRLAKS